MMIIERVARVLAGEHLSPNAEGGAEDEVPVAALVDAEWRTRIGEAIAVLKTLREPDAEMVAAGDAAAGGGSARVWEAMVRAALDEADARSR